MNCTASLIRPNSPHMFIRHLAHVPDGLSNTECVDNLSLRFVARPEPALLDTTCVEQMRPPPFVLQPESR